MVRKLLIIFLMFFLLTVVSAQGIGNNPNVEVNVEGIQIQYPAYQYIPANKSFNLFFHIYNITNGKPLDNSTANCILELYNGTGDEIYDVASTYNGQEFFNEINSSIFTVLGQHSYLIECETANFGGFASGVFYVARDGLVQITDAQLKVVHTSFWFMVLITVMFFVLSFMSKNEYLQVMFTFAFIVMLLVSTMYSMVIMDNLNFFYENVFNSYSSFYYIFIVTYIVLLFAFIIWAIFRVLQLMNLKRWGNL